MPLYAYRCTCGLRFDRRRAPSEATVPATCPSCGGEAPRLPGPVRVAYGATAAKTPVPQNTGLTGADDSVDRVIGGSAAAGWQVAKQRRQDKVATLEQNPGARPEHLRNAGDHYEVLPQNEAAFRERADRMVDPARDALTAAARREREAKRLPR